MKKSQIIVLITFIQLITMSCSVNKTNPIVVAHRGASADAPENTLPAFRLAWEQGADAIEGDFQITADGVIVCIHDKDTKRVSGEDLLVKDVTYEELLKLDVGVWKDSKWQGTYIPTITEVFETIPDGKKIYVEVKAGTEILPRLYEEIESSGLDTEQIVLISFNADVVREFKKVRPQHKVFWLTGLSVDSDGIFSPDVNKVLQILEETGADGVSSHHAALTGEFVGQIQDAGYEYHVWTVDDPERAAQLIGFGVGSVTTNVPALIIDHLQEN